MPGDHRYPITPLTAEDREPFATVAGLAFGETVDDDWIAHTIAAELTDPSLSLVARDDGRIIGTATVLDYTMSVPDATPVRCAGVTSVTVASTHRRRGVMRSLMRRQLDDVRAAGTAWAALYASESVIYGRFGYGIASRSLTFRLDGPWTRFAQPPAPTDIHPLDPADAPRRLAAIHEQVRGDVPGMMSMSEADWKLHLDYDPAHDRSGATARQVVWIPDAGAAVYRVLPRWSDAGPDGRVRVERCMATGPAAWRALWHYLGSIDLTQHLEASLRPVDDPLPWLLSERRRLRISEGVPFYIRLVDVGAALSSRGTRTDTDVVVDVTDAFCPWNAHRWRLQGDGATLRCEPTDAYAEVALDVRELASLSLGGVTPAELAVAGLVDERRAGALDRLGDLLAARRPPWNPFIF